MATDMTEHTLVDDGVEGAAGVDVGKQKVRKNLSAVVELKELDSVVVAEPLVRQDVVVKQGIGLLQAREVL
jgi:hypothetical protein